MKSLTWKAGFILVVLGFVLTARIQQLQAQETLASLLQQQASDGNINLGGSPVSVTPDVASGVVPAGSTTTCRDISGISETDLGAIASAPEVRVGEVLKLRRDNCFYRCGPLGTFEGPVQQEVPGKGLVTCDTPTGQPGSAASAAQPAGIYQSQGSNPVTWGGTTVAAGSGDDPTIPASANEILNTVNLGNLNQYIKEGKIVDLTGGQFFAQLAAGSDPNDCATYETETTPGMVVANCNKGTAGSSGSAAAQQLANSVGQAQAKSTWGGTTVAAGSGDDPTIPAEANQILNTVTLANLDQYIKEGKIKDLTGGQFFNQLAAGSDPNDCATYETETTLGMVVANCNKGTAGSSGTAARTTTTGTSGSSGSSTYSPVRTVSAKNSASVAAAAAQIKSAVNTFNTAASNMSNKIESTPTSTTTTTSNTAAEAQAAQGATAAVVAAQNVVQRSQEQLQADASQRETNAAQTTGKGLMGIGDIYNQSLAKANAILSTCYQACLDPKTGKPKDFINRCSGGEGDTFKDRACNEGKYDFTDPYDRYWCARLVVDAWRSLGVKLTYQLASAPALSNELKKLNALLPATTPADQLKPGMAMFLNLPATKANLNNHVGIIKEVVVDKNGNGYLILESTNVSLSVQNARFVIRNNRVGGTDAEKGWVVESFGDPSLALANSKK